MYLAYYNLSYAKNKVKTFKYLDSLYQNFAKAATRRFELGETNYLEMLTAKSKQKQLETFYKQAEQDVVLMAELLKKVVQVDSLFVIDESLVRLKLASVSTKENAGLLYFEDSKNYYKALYRKEKQNLLPDISLEYFQGSNTGLKTNLKGYQFGIKIPLFFNGNSTKIKASKIAKVIVAEEQENYKVKLNSEYKVLLAKLQQYNEAINYYQTQGKKLSKEIIKTAQRTFIEGEIDFFKYIQSIETGKEIELVYLENLNLYNQTIIKINYLTL